MQNPDPRAAAAFEALEPEAVRKRVRAVLAERGVSGVELAARLDVNQPWIARRMSGRVPFGATDVIRIADAIGVDAKYLLPVEVST